VEAAGWVSSIASSLMLLYTFGFIAFRQARTRQAKPKLRLLKDTSEGAAPEGIDYAKFRAGLSLSQLSTIVFRYSDVTLVTRRLSCLARPFHTGVLLRLLTFGSITIEDELGSHVRIGPRWLLHAAFKLLQERIGSRSLLAELTRRLAELEEREDLRPRRARAAASHIVYLRTDFVFDVVAGGSLGHIAGVVNNLAPCGLTPILLSTTRIPTIDPSIETHVIEPDRHFWNIEGLPILAFNFRCLDEAERICNGRDVGAVYQRYSTNNFTGAALAAKLQVPFVLEYNGSEIWINRHWGQPLPREELAQRIENVNLRRADLIVVVSEVSKAELVERGIPPTKILVNPNGVDPSRFHPDIDGTAVRRRLGFADDDVVLGFIGTFGRWHGSEQLARAFVRILRADQATPARLLLIGDGPHAEATRRLLTDADPRGRSWHMTGRVQQDSAPTYLAAADVLVSPHVPNPDGTPFFGSPTKIFEYMAMGRGIVASALGQLADVLDDGRTALLVPPGDEAALAAGLEKLIMSRQLRESLGTNARAVVEESYTWRIHTRRIIERLAEILGETSGRVL
jgi:glycosyltransferase involved in cell wall biosynthesis